jgi:hypothetical protein
MPGSEEARREAALNRSLDKFGLTREGLFADPEASRADIASRLVEVYAQISRLRADSSDLLGLLYQVAADDLSQLRREGNTFEQIATILATRPATPTTTA